MPITNLPKKLRALRRLKRINNYELADFLGVSYDTLKRWLYSDVQPSICNEENLVEVFDREGV